MTPKRTPMICECCDEIIRNKRKRSKYCANCAKDIKKLNNLTSAHMTYIKRKYPKYKFNFTTYNYRLREKKNEV